MCRTEFELSTSATSAGIFTKLWGHKYLTFYKNTAKIYI